MTTKSLTGYFFYFSYFYVHPPSIIKRLVIFITLTPSYISLSCLTFNLLSLIVLFLTMQRKALSFHFKMTIDIVILHLNLVVGLNLFLLNLLSMFVTMLVKNKSVKKEPAENDSPSSAKRIPTSMKVNCTAKLNKYFLTDNSISVDYVWKHVNHDPP